MKEAIDTEYPVLIVKGVCVCGCVYVCVCVIKHRTCHYNTLNESEVYGYICWTLSFFRSNLIILNSMFYMTLTYFNYMLQVRYQWKI